MESKASDWEWRLRRIARTIPRPPQFPPQQQLADRPAFQPFQSLQQSIHRERPRRELPLLAHPG